jgi:hypothetical protein
LLGKLVRPDVHHRDGAFLGAGPLCRAKGKQQEQQQKLDQQGEAYAKRAAAALGAEPIDERIG